MLWLINNKSESNIDRESLREREKRGRVSERESLRKSLRGRGRGREREREGEREGERERESSPGWWWCKVPVSNLYLCL